MAGEPFALLMWDYMALRDTMRVDALLEESDRIRVATLNAMAHHKPPLLDREDAKLKARIRAYGKGAPAPSDVSRAELIDYGLRLDAKLDLDGVFDDIPKGPVS